MHEHADGDTCLFRQWNDDSRAQFTQFLESEESKQVLGQGLEQALRESDTFRNVRDIMHSQPDRGSGQRHASRHQPTVGRGMRAAAENGEEESRTAKRSRQGHLQQRTNLRQADDELAFMLRLVEARHLMVGPMPMPKKQSQMRISREFWNPVFV